MQKSALRRFAIGVLLFAIGSLSGEDSAHSKQVQDFEIEGVASGSVNVQHAAVPAKRTVARLTGRVTGAISPTSAKDTTEASN